MRLFALAMLLWPALAFAQATPGSTSNATGGRAGVGDSCVVSNAATVLSCFETPGAFVTFDRCGRFDISGVGSDVNVADNITISGQTCSTGDGEGVFITNEGASDAGGAYVNFRTADNVIITHVSFSAGVALAVDGIGINGGPVIPTEATTYAYTGNISLRNVTTMFARDELLAAAGYVEDVVFEDFFAHSGLFVDGEDTFSGYGALISARNCTVNGVDEDDACPPGNVSMIRGLFAHAFHRCPRFAAIATAAKGAYGQVVNVVSYNCKQGTFESGDNFDDDGLFVHNTSVNWVNNLAIPGPDTDIGLDNLGNAFWWSHYAFYPRDGTTHVAYMSGNRILNALNGGLYRGWIGWIPTDAVRDADPSNARGFCAGFANEPAPCVNAASSAFTGLPASYLSPEAAYFHAVNDVGATKPNEFAYNISVKQNVKDRDGALLGSVTAYGGWPTVGAGTTWADTDSDGMDDAWEGGYACLTVGDDDAFDDEDGDGTPNIEEFSFERGGYQTAGNVCP